MPDNTAEQSYGASQIQVLEGLEPVRKRPGMYIGSTDERGLHHLVYEVVDNSVDEAMAGYCDKITVTLKKDGSALISDNGRGIPVDVHPKVGKSSLEVALTMLHAGGKFGGEGYKVSGGLHGVGVSVVNALSSKLIAQVRRDGCIHEMTFLRGEPQCDISVVGDTLDSGTTIQFWPDSDIFETTDFDFDTLRARMRELAFLNRGVRIIIEDERTQKHYDYCFEGGIIEFVKYLSKNKNTLHPEPIYFCSEKDGTTVEIAMQYNESYNENLFTYANNIPTHEGGTHLAMEGPQFSTLAESRMYREVWGCDVIGMTNMPEARLAREAELCYAPVAMVTDYDSWHPAHGSVDITAIVAILTGNAGKARATVAALPAILGGSRAPCPHGCDRALDHAILTAPERRDPAVLARLDAVAGRVLG